MSDPANRLPLVEVYERHGRWAISAAADGDGTTWSAGVVEPVEGDPASLGAAIAARWSSGQDASPPTPAGANGSWCAALGVTSLLDLVDGLRTVVLAGQGQSVALELIGADGKPTPVGTVDSPSDADPTAVAQAVIDAIGSDEATGR